MALTEEEKEKKRKRLRLLQLQQQLAQPSAPKVDETEGTFGRAFAETVGPAVEAFSGFQKDASIALPATLHQLGMSAGSMLGLVDEQEAQQVFDRNQPIMDTPGGMAMNLATEATLGGGLAGLARKGAVKYLPKAVDLLKRSKTAQAVTGGATAAGAGALASSPEQTEAVAGIAGGFDLGIRGLPVVGKFAGKGLDWMAEQLAEQLKKNPGMRPTEAAKRLKELVPDINIPSDVQFRNALVRKAYQLANYLPFTQGKKEYDEAADAVQRQIFRDAGSGAGPFPQGDMGFQAAYRTFDDQVKGEYDQLINKRDFDAAPLWGDLIETLQGMKGPATAIRTKIFDAMTSAAGKGGGRVKDIKGEEIGHFKRELRRIKDLDSTTTAQRRLLDDVITQTDENVFKILGEPDAARLAELNRLAPQRSVLTKSMAKEVYGQAEPTTFRQSLTREAPEKSLARGEAKGSNLIDTAADVLGKPASEKSSPFATAALLTLGTLSAILPTIALVGKRKVVQQLLRGEVPDLVKNTDAAGKLEKLMRKSTLADREDLVRQLGLGIGTAEILREE